MQLHHCLSYCIRTRTLQFVPLRRLSQCQVENELKNTNDLGDFAFLFLRGHLGSSLDVMKQYVVHLGRLILQDELEALTRQVCLRTLRLELGGSRYTLLLLHLSSGFGFQIVCELQKLLIGVP